jgi:cytosine/adenosine deaminase-related metal-dependent hydrolase
MSKPQHPSPWTLTARWVFPVSRPPLERGTITIAGERFVAVEPHGARAPDVDLGDAAVVPGFVNAHTHLDLSGLRGRCAPSPDFTGWLRQVIAHRRATTPEQTQTDIRAGVAECLRYGTTLVGDIASGGASWDALAEAPLRAVVFYEVLGLSQDRAEEALAGARAWMETHAGTATCRPAVSPHAPYSTRADLIGRCKMLAAEHAAPVAIHLAETAAELELMRHRRGPFVAFLNELGVWEPSGLARSPAQVRSAATGQLRIPQLLVHGNYLARNFAVRPQDSVVYCPRTHAAFGHPPHPFRDFLRRGVRVALGTDSLASNPDLDLFAEARFLRQRHPDVPGETLLRMATLSGAETLGWADTTGSLDAGKSADLVAVTIPARAAADPHDLVFDEAARAGRVLCRGAWVGGEEA